ncbi:ornithine cyclodeaminase family protein [Nonomuraea sp. SBT364]|uniref:ornithine cyclodeaminase family protein n=1 Tax=Nonomuraea sp. SBT364 TaxID=1580530 RepID=UPI00066B6581|nr:ornithine cyclodeaminase [Nonomuraea sp. SBT364]
MTLPHLDAEAVRRLVPVPDAVRLLRDALLGGLDPEATPQRPVVALPAGQLLLMPAAAGRYAGVKAATVAPGNAALGLPRIQGTYLLFDGETLAPLATMDGIALTSLRTPAVSALAVRHLAEPDARDLLVFGTGPQAWGHVVALGQVRPIGRVTVVGRDPARTEAFAARCRDHGLAARALLAPGEAAGAGGGAVAEAVAAADVIVCCTSAREPLFDGGLVRDGATVVAIGSHEQDVRELDGELVARATVVVEARSAALAEAGDVVIPIRHGTITAHHLAGNLAELVAGRVAVGDGPRVFKGTGMAWQDLVVAAAAYEAWSQRT